MQKAQYWQELVGRFNASKLGAKEFAKQAGVAESTLRRYCRTFSVKKESLSAGFEMLTLKESPKVKEAKRLLIYLPNNFRCEIEVSGNQDMAFLLKELITIC